jgi:hypothetical protein
MRSALDSRGRRRLHFTMLLQGRTTGLYLATFWPLPTAATTSHVRTRRIGPRGCRRAVCRADGRRVGEHGRGQNAHVRRLWLRVHLHGAGARVLRDQRADERAEALSELSKGPSRAPSVSAARRRRRRWTAPRTLLARRPAAARGRRPRRWRRRTAIVQPPAGRSEQPARLFRDVCALRRRDDRAVQAGPGPARVLSRLLPKLVLNREGGVENTCR